MVDNATGLEHSGTWSQWRKIFFLQLSHPSPFVYSYRHFHRSLDVFCLDFSSKFRNSIGLILSFIPIRIPFIGILITTTLWSGPKISSDTLEINPS